MQRCIIAFAQSDRGLELYSGFGSTLLHKADISKIWLTLGSLYALTTLHQMY